jgi:hypothetical protein
MRLVPALARSWCRPSSLRFDLSAPAQLLVPIELCVACARDGVVDPWNEQRGRARS